MISTEEWKRRNRYCDEHKCPEPCDICPSENYCEPNPESCYNIPIEGLESIHPKHLYIQAGHRYGFHSPVGYYQCVFLNRWLLGLEPFEQMRDQVMVIEHENKEMTR